MTCNSNFFHLLFVPEFLKSLLKIADWFYVALINSDCLLIFSEEILLENVELILEAFDYLQLPFALKDGTCL